MGSFAHEIIKNKAGKKTRGLSIFFNY